jgi:exonuclease SbcD
MLSIAAEFSPDLIVHTGDMFDGSRPSHDDLLRALRAVRRFGSLAPIVIIAGNHDSASCFELLAEAVDSVPPTSGWEWTVDCDAAIRFLPKPCTPERGAVATYRASDGSPIRLACLPFVHANRVITGFEDIALLNATYADKVKKIIANLSEATFRDFDPAEGVAVWASHLHVDGAQLSSERAVHVAESYATDPAHLDAGYSYLAFGHIHRPQELPGGRGRYAGSPLEIDFGEEGERKTVVCVTAEPGTRARVEPRELAGGRRLRRLRGSLQSLRDVADEVARSICVVTVDEAPDELESLNDAVRSALPDACIVQVLDGRRPGEVALDDLSVPEPGIEEHVGNAYRRWLSEGNDPGVPGAHLQRVVELFDELLAAAEGGECPDPGEAGALARMETDDITAPALATGEV